MKVSRIKYFLFCLVLTLVFLPTVAFAGNDFPEQYPNPECSNHVVVPLGFMRSCDAEWFEGLFCETCGFYESVTTPPLGHNFEFLDFLDGNKSSCINGAVAVYTCSNVLIDSASLVCRETKHEPVPALGHAYTGTSRPLRPVIKTAL